MFEGLMPLIKSITKEMLLILMGALIGLLLSGVVKYHYRNECIERIRISNVLGESTNNNIDKNIDTIQKLCGKL